MEQGVPEPSQSSGRQDITVWLHVKESVASFQICKDSYTSSGYVSSNPVQSDGMLRLGVILKHVHQAS